MAIDTLLFDLDDTLFATYPAHKAALEVAAARASELNAERSAAQVEEAFAEATVRLRAEILAGQVQYSSPRTWELALRLAGLPDGAGGELARFYLSERRRRSHLYPDVPPVLDELAARYRLVLVTNGRSELQRDKIAAVDLERWITRIVVSEEVGSWKPHPEIFRRALELAEASPETAVMTGDSLEADIAGAQQLGIRAVWIRRLPHQEPVAGIEPDLVIQDLSPLPATLEEWSGG